MGRPRHHGPLPGPEGAAGEEQNRERQANARGDCDRRAADELGGANARRDDGYAREPDGVGARAGAGRAGRAVSGGSGCPGRAEGQASAGSHASSLGHDRDGADVWGPPAACDAAASAAHRRRGSDLADGGGVSGAGSPDRADDAAAFGGRVHARLRRQSRSAARRDAHAGQHARVRSVAPW